MTEYEDSSAYVSQALEAARVVDDVPADTPLIAIEKVGIIGAGTMGGGIAMNFANIGVPVRIVETKQEALDRGLGVIRGNYERSANRGRFPIEEVDVRMARISSSLDMTDLADCDIVIEAVFEDLELKKSIFAKLDGIVKQGAILASNTSGLDVNQIAEVTSRPEAVIGLHFFSPANVMKLLEIVRGDKTSNEVIATSLDMARRIGKVAVVVGVCPGFVGNRMLYPRQLQAAELLKRGAMPWDVDRVLRAFGFKMGPFEMSDLAGLDIGWVPGEGDPLRDQLCKRERRGQKTGKGYYDYDANRAATPSDEVAALIRETLGADPDATPPSDDEILETCLFPMVNEGAKILEEKMAQRPSDVDVVWMFGYNWPQDTGGPMRWADKVGLEKVAAKAEELGKDNGWYAPAALLKTLVSENRKFADL
ncbi:3-hydroxyacyl-CoA dehydrogenase [Sphingopyxis sp. 113P3]|uniref:3-hydroxyacyl-CoA dehydrogenase n=1 Tax=Sphingopyxis sp. (strain 113P3) TaxID=292913 RepID=UPI0006AD560D|nr:3-hydroxyacyl-CoA dehydrogenase [Sphingopyxis sp. 113P3]ALC10483.1 3-hydroxyacyl-CoA dehydrogenase [Sphingopyxis sp. 113P3]